jgi:hypothetical protein
MGDVEIRQLEHGQLGDLLNFLTKWAPDHPELGEGEIIRWQRCHKFVAFHDGRIVGYVGQIPHEFRFGRGKRKSESIMVGWGVTLVLDTSDDQIRKKAGRMLLARCENNPPLVFAGVGVVPAIEGPYRRRGHAVRRDCCNMYSRFIKPSRPLQYLRKSPIYVPPIRVANLFLKAKRASRIGSAEKIERFKDEWDAIWDRHLSEQYELYGVRNAAYLNYKLSQPNRDYRVYVYGSSGYIVFRIARHRIRDLKLTKICDLVGSYKEKLDLLSLAVDFAYRSDSHGIVAISSVDDESMFRKAGLYISRSYPVMMPRDMTAKMHVTFFDSDLDNLW